MVLAEPPALAKRTFANTPLFGRIDPKALALDLDRTDKGVTLNWHFLVASAAQAKGAAEKSKRVLTQMRARFRTLPPQAKYFVALLGKTTISSDGAVLSLEMPLTMQEVTQLFVTPFKRYLQKAAE